MKVVAIILTFNEELHLARCISSLQSLVSEVLVVDCFSTDNTIRIAESLGARVVQRAWQNYASQFNWALTQLPSDTDWIIRIDADETVSERLGAQIRERLPCLDVDVDGVYWGRRIIFHGCLIRRGGIFPVYVIRLFRYGRGHCEKRWMDEHIKVSGRTKIFEGEIIDENLNSLSWWIEKHNAYASREAVDMLNLKYHFMPLDSVASLDDRSQAGIKRWVKERIYSNMPPGVRVFLYFFYRYIIRLGFLEKRPGQSFHILQGFWYRYLVDMKMAEVELYMKVNQVAVGAAIERVLGIKI